MLVVQMIQPKETCVLDRVDLTAPPLQHELNHTDQEYLPSEICR